MLPVSRSGSFSTQTRRPPHFSGDRWSIRVQQEETGSDVLTLMRRSRDHVYSTPTPSSDLITTNCLEICIGVLKYYRIQCMSESSYRVRGTVRKHCCAPPCTHLHLCISALYMTIPNYPPPQKKKGKIERCFKISPQLLAN